MNKQFLLLGMLSVLSLRMHAQTPETEPNNAISDAGVQTITADGSFSGSYGFNDLEYYKLAPGISGNITVTFTNAPVTNGIFLADVAGSGFLATTNNPGSFTYSLNPSVNYVLYTGTGTATGAWKFSISGLSFPGAALQFDGVDDLASSGNALSTAIDPLNHFTAEAWVNPSTTSGLGTIIGNYRTPSTGMQFLLRRDADQYTFWVDDGNGFKSVSSGIATATVGAWQHVAGVWNGSELLIYINGLLKATTTGVTGPSFAPTSNSVILGYNTMNETFNGSMDELRLWSTARTPCELLTYKNCEIPGSAAGLLANYHFNQGAGGASNPSVTSLTDASGNAYHAALSQFALTGSSSNWIYPGAVNSGFSTAAAPNVEINVKGNGNAIANNNLSPSLSDHTDFGTACVNAVLSRTFTIENTGASALLVNSGAMSGANAGSFTLSAVPASIAAGSSNTVSVSFSAATAGIKNATLSFVSTDCDEASYSFAVTASVVPTPVISVNSGSICAGQSFSLVPLGAFSYTYSSGSALVSPASSTSYSVTGASAEGCPGNMAVSSVTVNSIPVISVNSGTLCSGESFTMSPTGASTYSFSGGTAIVSPTTSSSYSVSGTSAEGCLSSSFVVSSLTVHTLPVISVANGTICAGQSFTLSPTGASTYAYSGGTAVVSPSATSTYSITGTDANGCVSSAPAISNLTVHTLPVITVASGSICTGQSFTLSPTGASTYTYSGGTAVVSPSATTSYSISGTSANGCLSNASAISTITVHALPVITVASGSICTGQSFTLSPSGASTYTYSGGTAVVSPSATTSYSVTGTSANGCLSNASAISTVTVNTRPVISVANGTICAGQSFTLSPSGASTYTYSGGTAVVSPSSTSTYSITGTSSNGCLSSAPAISNLTVHTLPVITVASGSICTGQSFTLSPSGASTYTYSGGTAVVSPSATTSYSISGTSSNGCLSNASAISTVTVHTRPVISVANGTICAGQSFTLSPTGASTYTYSGGTAVVSPSATTSYSVTGTSANGCVGNAPAISQVVVNALPTLSVSSTSSLLCAGASASLTATGALTYTWSTTETTALISISPSVTTTYTVSGTNANGCKHQTLVVQNVSPCTGINAPETASAALQVYPNPTEGIFFVELKEHAELIVSTMTGQVIKQLSVEAGLQEIDLRDQANGIYLLTLSQHNSQQHLKLIKH